MIVTFLSSSTRYFGRCQSSLFARLMRKEKSEEFFANPPLPFPFARHEHWVRGQPLFIKQKTPLSRRLMCLRLPLCPGYDSLPQTGWGREPENIMCQYDANSPKKNKLRSLRRSPYSSRGTRFGRRLTICQPQRRSHDVD